jgi:hypothetical protein
MKFTKQEHKTFLHYNDGPQEEPCPGCGATWHPGTSPSGGATRWHTLDCRFDLWVDQEGEDR